MNVFVVPAPVNVTSPRMAPEFVNVSPPATRVTAPSIWPALSIVSPDLPRRSPTVLVGLDLPRRRLGRQGETVLHRDHCSSSAVSEP